MNDAPTGFAPVVTGTTMEDQVLTADTSGIADADGLGSFSYQWQRSSDGGTSWSNVGSDAATLPLGDADVGNVVRVTVSYTDGHGTAESVTSAQTAAIGNVNDAPTGGVTIDNATPARATRSLRATPWPMRTTWAPSPHLEGRWRGGRQRRDVCPDRGRGRRGDDGRSELHRRARHGRSREFRRDRGRGQRE